MVEKYKNYIAGEWAGSDDYIENRNPSDTSDVIGAYAQATEKDLDLALSAAKSAQKIWSQSGIEKRYSLLMNIGQELMTKSKELGYLLAREEGKPIAEGVGEVYRSGQFFTYYAAETLRQMGDYAKSVRADIDVLVSREPIGVVGVISPWNFPVATASWKIAPALAFGNAVIWKPANLTPASAVALAEIFAKQDMPKGLFNLVMGKGSSIGQGLASSAEIDAVTFTGSVEVGRGVAKSALKHMTKVQLEMGSKNALLVMDDADMQLSVSSAVGGAFGGTGQKCTASSRLVVHAKIYDEFVDKLSKATKALKVGHALHEGTQMGPVVSSGQLKSNLDYVNLAKKEGATLLTGGKEIQLKTAGYYMEPTIFTDSNNNMRINREEMFAPIACVIKVENYEEGLSIVNDTNFGLTSGIMTKSLARANDFREKAKTGCVMVNLPTAGTDYHVPFGGRKDSSYGTREQGSYAAEFYTSVKTAYSFAGKPEK